MKILNLYCGIGGNRRLWEDVEVVAVEYNAEIAAIYQEYFPDDTVIVADAHEYLLRHYKEFDFIWSSPPCQTHSRLVTGNINKNNYDVRYPDMKLWQEIVFLKKFSTCYYVIENVIPYYDIFLPPTIEIDRHLFWSNLKIKAIETPKSESKSTIENLSIKDSHFGYSGKDLAGRKTGGVSKGQILANLVNPEIGLAILDQVRGIKRKSKLKQISILDVADGA